jgi:hypothetical protein
MKKLIKVILAGLIIALMMECGKSKRLIRLWRRNNPYTCRLLRRFFPRNDNLTEDIKQFEQFKPFEPFKLFQPLTRDVIETLPFASLHRNGASLL